MDTDVLISGGGLAGSVLALLLGRVGIHCSIIESRPSLQEPGTETADPRALTLTPATRRILESVDVWRRLPPEQLGRFEHMEVWDEAGSGRVRFDCESVGSGEMGHVVAQSVLQAALDHITDVHPAITVLRGAGITQLQYEGERAEVTLEDGHRLQGRLIVAADGIHSPTRERAGIEYRFRDYRQQAVACRVRTEWPHDRSARQRFLKSGPLAFLPLPDPHECGIVWSASPERARELLDMDATDFHRVLGEAFEHTLGNILDSGPRSGFPLGRAQAERYCRGRLVLIGDAAHCIHPLAGQGANMGFLDAASLAEVMAAARDARRDIGGHAVLRKYERWRRGENYLMMMVLEGFKVLFENETVPVQRLRNLGMSAFDSVPLVKNRIMRRAMGLEGDLPAVARRGG